MNEELDKKYEQWWKEVGSKIETDDYLAAEVWHKHIANIAYIEGYYDGIGKTVRMLNENTRDK